MHDIGLVVKCVVTDQGSNNQSLFDNYLKVSPSKPYFTVNDNKIFVMYDPPHLLKSIRNNFHKYDLCFDGRTVSFKHIEALYKLESTKVIGLKLTPKLTQKHISLTGFSKMNVKLASQVFSHSVYMLHCHSKDLPPEAADTAEFVRKVDNLFDCFNSDSLHSCKLFKCALRSESVHKEFLLDTAKKLESCTFIGCKKPPHAY